MWAEFIDENGKRLSVNPANVTYIREWTHPSQCYIGLVGGETIRVQTSGEEAVEMLELADDEAKAR